MPRRKSLVTAWSRALARLRDHGLLLVALAALALVVDGCPRFGRQTTPPAPPPAFQKINHIIVIYLENRSFDNLFGLFPGANGIAAAGSAATQRDPHGLPYEFLPPVMNVGNGDKPTPDLRFPEHIPNGPFEIRLTLDAKTGDPVHRFYQEQEQIDDGRMDRFAAVSNAGGLTMGYYDGHTMRLWRHASRYAEPAVFCQVRRGPRERTAATPAIACVAPGAPRPPDAGAASRRRRGRRGSATRHPSSPGPRSSVPRS